MPRRCKNDLRKHAAAEKGVVNLAKNTKGGRTHGRGIQVKRRNGKGRGRV